MTAERVIEVSAGSYGTVRCTTATHPGARRASNQDALLSRPDLGLWAVADGAGGHSRGEAAAQAVVAALDAVAGGRTAADLLIEVRRRLLAAHRTLFDLAVEAGDGMMASTVVALILRDGHFACLWAGDSRAYLARGGAVERLTVDHSVVQDLLAAGAIGSAEAEDHPDANVITRAVGAGAHDLEIDKRIGDTLAGDRLLLCSDGISKALPPAELAGHLCGGAVAETFVLAALARQAADNISAVVVDVLLTR
jgi:protein phosphatase/serine/threonine-protein phosphatase Stp1